MASEQASIEKVDRPATLASLVADLDRLGLSPGTSGTGHVVIVHTSLSALGWVAGGVQAVVEALFAAVGPDGTVVMPTQSGQLSDPAGWSNPPVPAGWIDTIRAEMPAYDPHLTPTREMGKVVECFRHHPATVRSAHPTLSLAANGPRATEIVGSHPLSPGLGDASPLGRLYDLDAEVLLVGVGHANNTSLHLAEYRAAWPSKTDEAAGAPVLVDGERQWVTYQDLALDEGDFGRIGEAFADSGAETVGTVGAGVARLCRQRDIVDFGVSWITANRR